MNIYITIDPITRIPTIIPGFSTIEVFNSFEEAHAAHPDFAVYLFNTYQRFTLAWSEEVWLMPDVYYLSDKRQYWLIEGIINNKAGMYA